MALFKARNASQITINGIPCIVNESIEINSKGDIIVDGESIGSIIKGHESINIDKDERPYIVIDKLEINLDSAEHIETIGNVIVNRNCGGINSQGHVEVRGDVVGDIHSALDTQVHGDVQGDIESNYNVDIKGNVTGDIDADDAVTIEGNYSGNINSGSDICIHGNAMCEEINDCEIVKVQKNLYANSLQVSCHGNFIIEGRVKPNEDEN